MGAQRTVAWLSAIFLLLLIARHEYVWFVTFQAPTVFRYQQEDIPDRTKCSSTSCYRYYGPDTAPYLVERWPDVDFDTGEFYGGTVPIAQSDPNRTLYFIFKPAETGPVDEIVIWLNGGPGCSSLYGFTSENGPISWQTDTAASPGHRKNPLAWSEISNVLWVDQPVGTGFSQGEVHLVEQTELATDFAGFFENWERLFGIRNYRVYLTGESFAGRYIPYIASAMLARQDKSFFDLSGALLYSPTISNRELESLAPRYQFVLANNDILHINQTTLQELNDTHSTCGYAEYMENYLRFPPLGIQSPPEHLERSTECDIVMPFRQAAHNANRCYNVYHITDDCPSKSQESASFFANYLNRPDVKEAIHAPHDSEWRECSPDVRTDKEKRVAPPIQGVLPRLIESTNRVLIASGYLDGVILTNGTLLAIQNMTWNGQLGFQKPPSKDFVVPKTANGDSQPHSRDQVKGIQHYERGLQWVGTYESGHEQPMYQPEAALRQLQWVLRRIDDL